jgi:IclR family KDG regulon transcriptional repressor
MLLANREWEQLAPLLEGGGLRALTLNTVTNIGELAEELEAVAERGYAYDHEESSIGLCCVAAPIYGRHAKVVAAASLCVPRYRFQQRKERYAAATVEAARLITTGACHRMRAFDPNLERG